LGRGKTYKADMAILLVKLPQSDVSFDETEDLLFSTNHPSRHSLATLFVKEGLPHIFPSLHHYSKKINCRQQIS
jgi:hypothetical protein